LGKPESDAENHLYTRGVIPLPIAYSVISFRTGAR